MSHPIHVHPERPSPPPAGLTFGPAPLYEVQPWWLGDPTARGECFDPADGSDDSTAAPADAVLCDCLRNGVCGDCMTPLTVYEDEDGREEYCADCCTWGLPDPVDWDSVPF